QRILEHEGGYVNDPDDPGGETKFGISRRAYPDVNIADLTESQAAEIYRRDYWDKVRGDELPDPVAHCVFDCAVNQGVSRAIKWMQEVAGTAADGIIGPQTLAAVRVVEPARFVSRYQVRRLRHYTSLRHWAHFGGGWSIRAVRVAVEAMELA
ncbi:MAG: hypothetical protein D6744_10775, partial [Planctomycetota bacterium]